MSAAECGGCKRRFSSDSAFDKHQTLPPPAEREFGKVVCHEPAIRGLVLNDRGQWAFPPGRPVPPQGQENAGLTGVSGSAAT